MAKKTKIKKNKVKKIGKVKNHTVTCEYTGIINKAK